MGIKFNPEELQAIAQNSANTYEAVKNLFSDLRNFCDNAGNNEAVNVIIENASIMEKEFNDGFLDAFQTFKKGISTYVDNTNAWEASMKKMEPISVGNFSSIDVENKITPIDTGN